MCKLNHFVPSLGLIENVGIIYGIFHTLKAPRITACTFIEAIEKQTNIEDIIKQNQLTGWG